MEWVWRFKSPASELFAQPSFQAHIKENIRVPCHWLSEGNSPVTGGFRSQRAVTPKIQLRMSSSCARFAHGFDLLCFNEGQFTRIHYDVIKWKYFPRLPHYVGNPPVSGGFPSQRISKADLWCFFVVNLNKLLNKNSIDRKFETSWRAFDTPVI